MMTPTTQRRRKKFELNGVELSSKSIYFSFCRQVKRKKNIWRYRLKQPLQLSMIHKALWAFNNTRWIKSLSPPRKGGMFGNYGFQVSMKTCFHSLFRFLINVSFMKSPWCFVFFFWGKLSCIVFINNQIQ